MCDILTNIEIPNSVTSIGGGAFVYCQSLVNIVIPNSVTSINGWFAFCSSLSSVEIPSSVTSINEFGEGNRIETIYGTKGSYSETYAKENGYIFMEK